MTTITTPIAIRRLVTGHNADGKSIIAEDKVSPFTLSLPAIPGLVLTDLWKTSDSPADNDTLAEPCSKDIVLTPPARGSILRTVQFPPDAAYMAKWDAREAFSAMKSESTLDPSKENKIGMHRTHTVDYAIVLSGEIWAVMDEGEALMRAGDILIQRGTNHGWSNRSSEPALVAFVLIDANPVAAGKA